MKIRTLLGLTVIGLAVYAHRRNGGDFTLDSMKKSLTDLWSGIRGKASDVKARAAELADKVPDKMKAVANKAAEPVSPARSAGDERYGANGPGPGGVGRGR